MFSNLFNKKTKFSGDFTTRLLSLDLEPGWIEDVTIPNPLTFFKEKGGKGALHVSIIIHTDSRIPAKEDLLSKHKIAKNIKEYSLREWNVYEFEASTNELFNKSFYLVKHGVIVFFTWYGSFESKDSKELEEARRIIHSISVTHKN